MYNLSPIMVNVWGYEKGAMAINASMVKSVHKANEYEPYKLQVNYIDGTHEYLALSPDEYVSKVCKATNEFLGNRLDINA